MFNIPQYSIENKKVIYLLLLIILIGGCYSFFELPKKEDSPFVIKTAVLVTQYPGATPQEVETLITEPIEREIQSMSEVDKIKSESYFGLSKITIDLNPDIAPSRMPAKWDELRRKVINIQPQLPVGASSITVNDDFGDVFGIYYGLTIDEGFSYNELRHWAQKIRTKLTPIEGVQKVMLYGEQTEVINVSITPSKLASLGIDPSAIRATLQGQNGQINTGLISTNSYQLRIITEGAYASLEDIESQLIVTKDGEEIRLGDIATVERGYYDPPTTLMRVNGRRAIGIGVATGSGDNVVAVGEKVDIELKHIKEIMPIGVELISLYPEDKIADEANNGFIINLIESLLIVIVIIFLAMGYRAGLLIGSSLIFSVAGALLIMWITGVGLNRTSLAAFIIAMGMLVDNAIVVTDNAQIGILRGKDKVQSLIDGALKPQWALLGATFIAVVSFLPMYLAPSSVAEIVSPLFVVLAVSLGLSWLLAMSQTTSFGTFILKSRDKDSEVIDPYDKPLYHKFGRVLKSMIRHRYLTLVSVVVILVFSLFIMGLMPQSFFPKMDKPYFRADLIYPEGFSIQSVDNDITQLEDYLSNNPKIKTYSITMGGTPLRYYLASSSFGPKPNYSNVVVEAHNSDDVEELEREFYYYMNENYPNVITRSALFAISPTTEAAIEIGFIGDNIDTLTMLVEKAKRIALESENVTSVRSNWGEKVPLWKPKFSQQKGLRLGVTREQTSSSLNTVTNGLTIGGYREGDLTLPILLKAKDNGEWNFNDIKSIPVFSTKGEPVNVEQVIDEFEVDYDYNLVRRYNRELCMMMQCEPVRGANLMDAFQEVWGRVQQEIEIPEGYKLKYFGEQEIQDQSYSALSKNMPLMFILMYFILLLLFPKNYRKPILIMLMLPLMFIGVVWGLIIFGKSLDFFAILGILGLIGMNIKNSIVLVEEIEMQLREDVCKANAIIEATKSRIIPVTMASGTTILGMLPLLGDAMFAGMASTIMGGLFVSTILTIFILPVTYCIFFKIKISKDEK
ncbi:MAG: efflux RND transporter permease subunit [Rikenellaceae bacterium]